MQSKSKDLKHEMSSRFLLAHTQSPETPNTTVASFSLMTEGKLKFA